MISFMLFIWAIGMMVCMGELMAEENNEASKHSKFMTAILILVTVVFLWPAYLGFAWGTHMLKMEEKK